ncbi:MAG: type II secretion system protein GspG [Verrucomicrobiota bacterium]
MKEEHGERKRGSQAGFTLLEILIVVAIIGVLASLAAVRLVDHMKGTKVEATHAQIKQLKLAINLFELKVQRLPTNLEELTIEGDEDWPGPFLEDEKVPTDGWKNEFKMIQKGKRLKLQSAGPDGVFDTGDDIVG